ncbi:hypothetical protein K402DRAFT_402094 [Aulographum hederae CBS 113979]|uniref:SSD domain-containing protein n=1 Tax=Aulographum hederae CBS 113979 TaxID=1176131 RepID=A0A6G1H8R9_9PEZI|nr:hypothetical protein K402DRAFT_402094 [Aulographum hederae CBS 113979]
MIWYLLYPFRGTTEPPHLGPSHPIRRAFYRHGTIVGRHWYTWILIYVVVAVLLCYPVVFLYENPTVGTTKLPHHVWTSARVYEGSDTARADVEIRQTWVYGSYMKALDRNVLLEALQLQHGLLNDGYAEALHNHTSEDCEHLGPLLEPDMSYVLAWKNISWGYHSPLMYWNCSSVSIMQDPDILRTINDQVHRMTFLNLTLRPASVFAGKSFNRKKLKAADAHVITLFDREGTGIGEQWNNRSMTMAKHFIDRWSFYPSDGKVVSSRLYEFRFKPMSFSDDLGLAMAYTATVAYVIVSLKKLQALKSKLGLVFAFITKITVAIVGSFTICGFLKIDLSTLPREAYPFVAVVLGLENMFRLINAVIEHPPEMSNVQRIASSLAEVGHLALAAAGQNLFLLWLLSRVVYPGVGAFCAFAAVALICDFLFHITFFVAVLSVDVQRLELRDSLERISNSPRATRQPPERQTWVDALIQGKLPFSTRAAGSVVLISFVLALNWHFLNHDQPYSIMQILRHPIRFGRKKTLPFDQWPSPPEIHAERTPGAWLKMQDHATGREMIRFVKPSGHAFIARVYDPVMVVLKDSIRGGGEKKAVSFWLKLRTALDAHLFPFLLALITTMAIVSLLMNYLLWNELPEDELLDDDADAPVLSVKTLPKSHDLDIIKVASCIKGHAVTVGLDRRLVINHHDTRTDSYSQNILFPSSGPFPYWPIIAAAIDDSGTWLALCSDNGTLAIWNFVERAFKITQLINLEGHTTLAGFGFAMMHVSEPDRWGVLMITPDAVLKHFDIKTRSLLRHKICSTPITYASVVPQTRIGGRVTVVTRTGEIHIAIKKPSEDWTSSPLMDPRLIPRDMSTRFRTLTCVPSLILFTAIRPNQAVLIDALSRHLIHIFQIGHVKGHSVRLLHSPRRKCVACDGPAVHAFSIVYTEAESNDCVMHSFAREGDHSALVCLRAYAPDAEPNPKCRGPSTALETVYRIAKPGVWEATSVQAIVGIRKRPAEETFSMTSPAETQDARGGLPRFDSAYSQGDAASSGTTATMGVRNRRAGDTATSSSANGITAPEPDEWEAWTLFSTGDFYTTPLSSPSQLHHSASNPSSNATHTQQQQNEDADQLFVSRPGPIARLGKRGIVVGFGNKVKVVTVGNERFEDFGDEYGEVGQLGLGAAVRRRARKREKMG